MSNQSNENNNNNINNNNNNNNNDLEDQVKKELAPGVILYKEYKKVNDDSDIVGIFIWKVELTTMSVVDFEVHLDQSENIELENKINNELKTSNRILPFEKKEVAKVILKDNWKLKSKFKLTMNVPEKQIQYNYIVNDEKKLEKEIKDYYEYFENIPFEFLTKEEIEEKLNTISNTIGNQIKFIDMDFIPNDDAVINSKYDENMKDYLDYIIHWRRPEEFITSLIMENTDINNNNNENIDSSLRIFNNNGEPEPNDIHQGLLPDNHLASAFSALAEKYNLIKRLFKIDKYNSLGIYQVKLCVNGEWNTIVIDDLFPCIPCSVPLVSRSQSNELWILILEKAMAKIFDCYYNLTASNIADFLMILTGCPTLYFSIEDELKNENKDKLIKKLKNYVCDKKYLTVAVSKMIDYDNNNNNEDIIEDHMLTIPNFGYTIIDVKNKFQENLIVLRKVWYDGNKEKIVQEYEESLEKGNYLISNELSAGTLILKFDDFLKEFSSFAVCYAKNWEEVRIRGKFVMLKDQEINLDSTLSKWYYCIQLEKATNLIISLHQDEDKFKENDSRKNLMDISLTVLKQDTIKNEISHIQTLDFSRVSNIQTELNLPPGNYIILPRTSGCFFGRPFNDNNNNNNTQIYNYEDKKFNPIFISTLKDIFKKFDLLLNRKLSYQEFKGFHECINTSTITEKEFEENVLNKYQSFDGGLTEKGFIKFFEDNFLSEDGENKIRNWLNLLGYDNDLYPLKSRVFMITFHSDNPLSVSVRDALNTDLNGKVNKIILKSLGEEVKNKKDLSVIVYKSNNSNVVSIGIINKGNNNMKGMLNFKENVITSAKKNYIEKIIEGGQYDFIAHYYSLNENNNNFDNDFSFDADSNI